MSTNLNKLKPELRVYKQPKNNIT